jgi:glycosyltransferase involved in cell wall biosynthesis
VIEHGVLVPPGVRYRGDLDARPGRSNHLAGAAAAGADLFLQARAQLPLDLVGMGAEELGGLGEVAHAALPAFAARYRFLFSPIRYSSLGLAVIEAMMAGMPVVALATAEMATVIENGENGFIDTDPARLVDSMRELLREPGAGAPTRRRRRRQRARALFGIERFSADWDAAFATSPASPPLGAWH